MEKNSNKLKLVGTVELMEELQLSHNYHVAVEGSITGSSKNDNEDGTFDETYKLKIATLELLNDKGEVIKAKDKRSMSKKLRGAIYFWREDHKPEVDDELFYNDSMGKIIANIDKILTYVNKLE